MFKRFLMKKMLSKHLKDVPQEQQEMIFKLVEDNPELFQKIGVKIQERMKSGQDQMTATNAVMMEHQEELKKIMGK